jgi:hypothetical protein
VASLSAPVVQLIFVGPRSMDNRTAVTEGPLQIDPERKETHFNQQAYSLENIGPVYMSCNKLIPSGLQVH